MKAETKRFNIVLPKLQVESESNGRCVIKVNDEYLFVNNWVSKRNTADKVLKEIQVQKLDNMRNTRY